MKAPKKTQATEEKILVHNKISEFECNNSYGDLIINLKNVIDSMPDNIDIRDAILKLDVSHDDCGHHEINVSSASPQIITDPNYNFHLMKFNKNLEKYCKEYDECQKKTSKELEIKSLERKLVKLKKGIK